jgi:hypothetical protein
MRGKVGEKLRRRIIWAKESWVIHKNGYGWWGRVIVDPGRSTLCNFLAVVQKGTMAPFFQDFKFDPLIACWL